MHSPFIGAYWASRKETKAECALRCASLLARLSSRPELSQWFVKGKTSKTASRVPLPASAEGVEPFLKTNNCDDNGEPIAELGFNLNVWNGSTATPATLSITCGAFSSAVRNAVVLNLPPIQEVETGSLGAWRELLTAIIEMWEPDDAVATSPQLIAQKGGEMPWKTEGWFNYRKGGAIQQAPALR